MTAGRREWRVVHRRRQCRRSGGSGCDCGFLAVHHDQTLRIASGRGIADGGGTVPRVRRDSTSLRGPNISMFRRSAPSACRTPAISEGGARRRPASRRLRAAWPWPAREGGFAFAVEVSVGFVEDDDAQLAVERAGQPMRWRWPPEGKAPPRRSVCRSPAAGAGSSHGIGALGRSKHRLRRRFAEAGDVLGDRAGEEFDILRQVADVFAEAAARPVGDVGPVKTDGAGIGRPDAKQQTQQR